MAIRYGRGDVKQTTTGFRGPLMVQSLTSAKSKFLSLTRVQASALRRSPSETKPLRMPTDSRTLKGLIRRGGEIDSLFLVKKSGIPIPFLTLLVLSV